MAIFDIKTYLQEKQELVNSYLKSYFDAPSSPSVIYEAMQYSLFAGGKRIRPILAIASYETFGGNPEDILPQASALELIHTYSLIHDDLPSMDNDELRRGKPTNHKVFGEAMAILAGDALLTEAFFMMTHSSNFPKKNKEGLPRKIVRPASMVRALREVALSAGVHGMVGGQAEDILSENVEPDRDTLSFIHLHKTAALITASVRIGAILANASKTKLNALSEYGENIGLAFQIIDDILDVEGNTEDLGKPTCSDIKKRKMTYPSLFGLEGARKKAEDLKIMAVKSLKIFSSVAEPLREIAIYLINRKT